MYNFIRTWNSDDLWTICNAIRTWSSDELWTVCNVIHTWSSDELWTMCNGIVPEVPMSYELCIHTWSSDDLWALCTGIRSWSSDEFGTVCNGISTWSCDELCSHGYSYTYKTPMNLWVPWNLENFWLAEKQLAYQEGRFCVKCVCVD
jgi:hypothetical protein